MRSCAVQIVEYPHPSLRHKSKPVRRVDDQLKQIVREMFELMYAAKGVGLAANQVDLPFRLFVVNPEGDPAAAEEQVFINPVLSKGKGMAEAEEGCLSLPKLYGQVKRPERVTVDAYNLAGERITAQLTDLPARIVQHEVDHLDGVLFIDRLSPTSQLAVREELDEFESSYEQRRQAGEIPDADQIQRRLAEWEERYC